MINESRRGYYHQKLQDCPPGKRWRVVNELLHQADRDHSRSDVEDRMLADTFSHFFTSKIYNLKALITSKLNSLTVGLGYHDLEHFGQLFDSIPPVTIDEVLRLLHTLPAKSSSLDYISTALIKSCPVVFSELISRFANLSFTQGVFPA